jgi:Glycosyltransferases, probably involved in cell wall biogenesis
MIPVYNCIGYLKDTLESVIQQALPEGQMQIEVIDDCSTDGDVGELVKRIGKGRVRYFRKETNGGSLRNFETCINRARGHWVHILHGDDMVSNGFYAEVQMLFQTYPEIGACFTAYDYINDKNESVWPIQRVQDHKGIIDNWLEKIAVSNVVQPPAVVVKREVYEKLGSFFAVHYGEDWEMWTRIAARYPVGFSPVHLAHYRVHNTNITTRSILSGQNIADVQKVIRIIGSYLPREKSKRLQREATRNFALYFATLSDRIYHEHGHRKAALIQAFLSMRMHLDKVTVRQMTKIMVKCMINYRRKWWATPS